MSSTRRRTFLKSFASGAAALSIPPSAWGAQRTINVALIGCGGRGRGVMETFLQAPGVRVTHVCDPWKTRLERAAKEAGSGVKLESDLRRVLDDRSVDAVIVATPDHWHSPASILACDAGKHVYVEKPCSHNLREGRLLVKAARRNKRLVQHGTQVRSTSTIIEAVKLLRSGVIGNVFAAKAWNIQRRGSIGHDEPSTPPPDLDYDAWVGPAPMIPYQKNRVDREWNWWFHFGVGDMGNDGVHDLEIVRWGLGVETHPSTIAALGGKYFFEDDQQFPDTQQVTFEYPGDGRPGSRRMLIYEQRLWSTNHPRGLDSGTEFYGTKGQLFVSRRGKFEVLGEDNQPVDVDIPLESQNTTKHVANFLAAIRGTEPLNAEIKLGHLTSSLAHLGNVAVRLGRSLKFDPRTEHVLDDDEADRMMGRKYRSHWGTPRVG